MSGARRVHPANVRLRAVAWHPSVESDGKGGVYDSSDVSRYEVSVCRKRIGAIVSDRWGYWRGELLDGDEVRGDYGYNGWSRAVWGLLQAATTRGDTFPEGFDVPPKGAAALLRAAAWSGQHGHVMTPRGVYVSAWCGRDTRGGYGGRGGGGGGGGGGAPPRDDGPPPYNDDDIPF